MPLEDLLRAIEADANAEAARLERESAAEAEAIVSAARGEAFRAREEILRSHAPATETEANRRRALARLEAARLEREAREEAFVLLLADVRRHLAAARDEPGYRETLRVLLAEALGALPGAKAVRTNPGDADRVGELLRAAGANLIVTPDPGIGGGVVVEDAGGRVVRNTLEERLANGEPRLRAWYGRRLEGLATAVVAR